VVQRQPAPLGTELGQHPTAGQVQHSQQPDHERGQPHGAQQVLRPLAEAGEELDGEQIEEPFEEAGAAVLRAAELARPVLDDQLAHTKPTGLGQNRHKAVQLAVQPHLVEHLAAIALHAAVVIVEDDPGRDPHHPVERPRRQHLGPGIVADLLPAADHVHALVHSGQEAGDFVGVVLEVGVQGEDQLAAGVGKPSAQGRRLPEVAAEPNPPHAGVLGGDPANRLPGAVRRAVVHENHLDLQPVRRRDLVDLLVQDLQTLLLAEHGDDDRQHDRKPVGLGGNQPFCGAGGLARGSFRRGRPIRYRIPEITSSDTTETSRMSTAETQATSSACGANPLK